MVCESGGLFEPRRRQRRGAQRHSALKGVEEPQLRRVARRLVRHQPAVGTEDIESHHAEREADGLQALYRLAHALLVERRLGGRRRVHVAVVAEHRTALATAEQAEGEPSERAEGRTDDEAGRVAGAARGCDQAPLALEASDAHADAVGVARSTHGAAARKASPHGPGRHRELQRGGGGSVRVDNGCGGGGACGVRAAAELEHEHPRCELAVGVEGDVRVKLL